MIYPLGYLIVWKQWTSTIGGKFQFFAYSSIEAAFPDGQGVLPTQCRPREFKKADVLNAR